MYTMPSIQTLYIDVVVNLSSCYWYCLVTLFGCNLQATMLACLLK